MHPYLKRLAIVAVLCFVQLAAAAEEGAAISAGEVERCLEPLFEDRVENGRVPGAVCVVVSPDRVLFSMGYGVMDLEDGRRVDPDRTVFRAASVSKLITVAAAMQLVEQDKLDLHADVNEYLDLFQLPDTYAEPVTLAHLLTHTGGFDERFLGMAAPSEAEALPLGLYLANRMPPRAMPPGKFMSYSNHGMALAGRLVEIAGGMPFNEYAMRHVFAPLGMRSSGFLLTPLLADNLAKGYDGRGGTIEPALYDAPQTVPASTLMTTGSDMARFMMAQLGLGAIDGQRILEEDTVRLMHAQQFTHHRRLPGRAYGFAERYENGLRILQQDGLIWGFRSRLILIPEKGLGMFVSCNLQTSGLPSAATARFLDHFFPAKPEPAVIEELPGFEERVKSLTGFYRHNRHVRSTFIRFGIIAQEFVSEIRAARGVKPGILTLCYVTPGSKPWRLAEVEPYCFRRIMRGKTDKDAWKFSGRGRVAFGRDDDGLVTHLFIDNSAYERLAWRESRPVLAVATAVSLAVMLSALIGWPLAYAVCGRRDKGCPRRATWLAGAACAFDIAFTAGLGLYLLTLNPYDFGYGPPPFFVALLVLPLIGAVLTLPLPVLAALAWTRRYWGPCGRIHFTLVTFAALLFMVLLNYWNLLGFRFG